MSNAAQRSKAGTPVLEMRNISKTFGSTRALSNVSLTVQPGEVHALMGENGAGKSTLMKVLSGAYTADAGGSILIDGNPSLPAIRSRQRPTAFRSSIRSYRWRPI
jgi:ribose transport system ATP-binding protein